MSMLLLKGVAAGLVGAYAESKYAPDLGTAALGLPTLFGLTPAVLTAASFWITLHGFMVVGGARKKYIELAKKDGEKDVDERYGLPNLYAQGTSKHAKAFNCAQRSHQQIFETFPQVCLMSMVGAVHYPIATAVTVLGYFLGRFSMSNAYANEEGDASKRYSNPFSVWTWYGLLTTMTISMLSSASFVMGKPVL